MAAHRILHVLGTASFAGKAVNQIVEKLAISLDRNRYQIDACFLRCGEFTGRFQTLGIHSICLDWNGAPADLLGAARYALLLRSGKYDLIHLHTGGRFLTWISRKFANARLLRHIHGRAAEDTGEVPHLLELPDRDATIANSRVVAEASGDPDAQVIYPGVDVTEFLCAHPAAQDVILGAACRLEPVKGLATLLEAIAMLAAQDPSIRLQIAGEGSLRMRLEEQAAMLGLSQNVSFLGWRTDMAPLLQSWSIFVQSSLDEGFGVAALEAMASGLPVIAADAGGLRELVDDGRTGFLVPSRDPAALAARIRLLLDDPDLRAKMGAAAHQRVEENFSAAAMVRKTADLYDRLLQAA